MRPISSRPKSACMWVELARLVWLFHQRTFTLVQWPKSLIRGDGGAHLVIVPLALRHRRLLHLHPIRGMNLAPVRAYRPLAEQRIVGRHFLHLRDDLGTVVALQRLD